MDFPKAVIARGVPVALPGAGAVLRVRTGQVDATTARVVVGLVAQSGGGAQARAVLEPLLGGAAVPPAAALVVAGDAALAEGAAHAAAGDYRRALEADGSDAVRTAAAVGLARVALARDDPAAATAALAEAVGRDDPLVARAAAATARTRQLYASRSLSDGR